MILLAETALASADKVIIILCAVLFIIALIVLGYWCCRTINDVRTIDETVNKKHKLNNIRRRRR